jgi:hypothetical protein
MITLGDLSLDYKELETIGGQSGHVSFLLSDPNAAPGEGTRCFTAKKTELDLIGKLKLVRAKLGDDALLAELLDAMDGHIDDRIAEATMEETEDI